MIAGRKRSRAIFVRQPGADLVKQGGLFPVGQRLIGERLDQFTCLLFHLHQCCREYLVIALWVRGFLDIFKQS